MLIHGLPYKGDILLWCSVWPYEAMLYSLCTADRNTDLGRSTKLKMSQEILLTVLLDFGSRQPE